MRKLEELFSEVLTDKRKWDYYRSVNTPSNDITDVFGGQAENFVQEYLAKGSKLDDVTRDHINLLAQDGNRIDHTLSIYFLGILFYQKVDKIKEEIDGLLSFLDTHVESDYEKTPFCYYWFLVCFFHDLGYVYEQANETEKIIEELIDKQSSPFNFNLPQPKSCRIVPEVFRKRWWNYLKYRRKERKKVDHGIIGGILFYRFRSIDYKRKKLIYRNHDFRDDKNLFWSKSILSWIHLSVAWIILGHNIWFIEKGDSKERLYQQYGLDGLITCNAEITLKKYPLLFLLSLVDSIDPIKKISQYDNTLTIEKIMLHLKFSFTGNSITINTDFSKKQINENYFKDVSSLVTWLNFDVNQGEGSFTLKIK